MLESIIFLIAGMVSVGLFYIFLKMHRKHIDSELLSEFKSASTEHMSTVLKVIQTAYNENKDNSSKETMVGHRLTFKVLNGNLISVIKWKRGDGSKGEAITACIPAKYLIKAYEECIFDRVEEFELQVLNGTLMTMGIENRGHYMELLAKQAMAPYNYQEPTNIVKQYILDNYSLFDSDDIYVDTTHVNDEFTDLIYVNHFKSRALESTLELEDIGYMHSTKPKAHVECYLVDARAIRSLM